MSGKTGTDGSPLITIREGVSREVIWSGPIDALPVTLPKGVVYTWTLEKAPVGRVVSPWAPATEPGPEEER